jgi:type II secretory pathway component PulF
MYITSVMAGEKSGALAEGVERFLSLISAWPLSVRKKIMLSLIYPGLLVVMVAR